MYVVISHAYAHSSALYEETTVLESSKDSFLRYMYCTPSCTPLVQWYAGAKFKEI